MFSGKAETSRNLNKWIDGYYQFTGFGSIKVKSIMRHSRKRMVREFRMFRRTRLILKKDE